MWVALRTRMKRKTKNREAVPIRAGAGRIVGRELKIERVSSSNTTESYPRLGERVRTRNRCGARGAPSVLLLPSRASSPSGELRVRTPHATHRARGWIRAVAYRTYVLAESHSQTSIVKNKY